MSPEPVAAFDDPIDTREAEWLAATARGERSAFELLYRAYHARLARFVASRDGPPGSDDEIVNDVMYVVWNRAASWDGVCRPSTWIFGIAVNKLRDARRSHARSVGRWSPIEALDEDIVDDRADPERLARDDDHRRTIARALLELNPEQRMALELTHFAGMNYREIAEVTGCAENTVKTRVFHARRRLAALLGESGTADRFAADPEPRR